MNAKRTNKAIIEPAAESVDGRALAIDRQLNQLLIKNAVRIEPGHPQPDPMAQTGMRKIVSLTVLLGVYASTMILYGVADVPDSGYE